MGIEMRHRSTLTTIAVNLLLAAGYFGAARLGLKLASVNVSVTVVWPPSGIALAALLVFGSRVWPGIFVGAFAANMATQGSLATVAAISAGNTLEGLLGAFLARKFASGIDGFLRPRNVFTFTALSAMLSTMVGATIGVTSLSLGGYAAWHDYGSIWVTWWLGDAVGALLLTPALVLWITNRRPGWSRPLALELALWVMALCLLSRIVFGPLFGIGHSQAFLSLAFLFPPLALWLAF